MKTATTNRQQIEVSKPLRMPKQSVRKNKRAYFISKKVGKAIYDYQMIEDGDRILEGVSGGKIACLCLRY